MTMLDNKSSPASKTTVEKTAGQEAHAGLLSPAVCAEIDKWVAKYPKKQKQSAVIAALMAAQKANDNFLTDDLIAAVATFR